MTSRSHDDLEPELAAAEAELVSHLEEACSLGPESPGAEDTGELLRLEDALDAARGAAERAVELRRERRARRDDAPAGVREFVDEAGSDWRVWCVTPTRDESGETKQLGAEYRDGWLAFEAFDGTERRRLPNFPAEWSASTDAGLADLLRQATPVAPRRPRRSEEASHDVRAD